MAYLVPWASRGKITLNSLKFHIKDRKFYLLPIQVTSHIYTDVKSAKKDKSFDVMISKWGWLFQVLSGDNQKISKPGLNAYTTKRGTTTVPWDRVPGVQYPVATSRTSRNKLLRPGKPKNQLRGLEIESVPLFRLFASYS